MQDKGEGPPRHGKAQVHPLQQLAVFPGLHPAQQRKAGELQIAVQDALGLRTGQIGGRQAGPDLDLQALRRIVVTHSHYDHVGSLLALKQAVAAQVLAHRDEVPFLTQAKRIPRPAGVPGVLFWLSEPLFRAPAIAVDQVLLDGSMIEGTGLQVVHTPGHTPGHICLYHAGRKALFTGDGLVNNQGKLSGPVPFFSSDIKQARASLTRLAELDIETFYFAHGETMRGISKEILRSLAGLSIPVAVAGK